MDVRRLRDDAAFAEGVRSGVKASADDPRLMIRADAEDVGGTMVEQVKAAVPGLWLSSVAARAIEAMKFSECLPMPAGRGRL